MNDRTQSGNEHASRRRGRGCFVWLAAGLAALLGLALVGYLYEPIAEAADAKAYPPPGQLVDLGGYRMHIHCTGSGSPTVVIDAGLGDWSTSWEEAVQPGVAKTTRVCTYDRAGMGWSDAGPLPRDTAQFARELHTLLQNAQIPGPYVMVGHSLGGLTVRVFVHEYAPDVAGVLLVESMNPNHFNETSPDVLSRSRSQSQPFSFGALLSRWGAARLLVKLPWIAPHVSANDDAYYARYIRTQSLQTTTDESQGMVASGAEASAVQSFGDLPLIVLTGRLNNNGNWQEWQKELLQLSSNSRQSFAEHSGHNLQVDEPDAAIAAITQMVEQVRP
jgi:pimeloyl-ACP methyl ester carboxylesterase